MALKLNKETLCKIGGKTLSSIKGASDPIYNSSFQINCPLASVDGYGASLRDSDCLASDYGAGIPSVVYC